MRLQYNDFSNTYAIGFLLKNLKIFKIGKGGKFAVECVSDDFIS